MGTDRNQTWVDQHALRFALGELEDTEEARFRELGATDPQWSGLLSDSDQRDHGHVPVALLARWSTAGRQLRGMERRLVLEHVQSCSGCAEELRLAGYAVDEWLAPVTGVASSPRTHQRTWLPWIGGSLIGAAAAVALMLGQPHEMSLHGSELPVITPRVVRGDDGAVLRLGQDAHAFLLATALPTDLPDGIRPRLRVLAPDGSLLSETLLHPTPWSVPSTQMALIGDPGFATGAYAVELIVPGEDSPRSLGRFRIEPSR